MGTSIPLIRNLDEILSENLGRKVELVSHSSKYLTAPGDNYGSTMLALEAKIRDANNGGEVQVLSLVAKMVPPAKSLWKVFQTLTTFKKENDIYTVTGPELLRLEREMRIPEEELLDVFPKCYGARLSLNPGSPVDKDALLLLENLKTTGYTIADRMEGFDEKEAKLILKNLAHFHAVPIALRIHDPYAFAQKVLPTIKAIDINYGMGDMLAGWTQGTLDALSSIPEVVPHIEKIKAALEEDVKYRKSVPPPIKEPFASIVHNDFWVNNMMLRYDANHNPDKIKMVDFQLTYYGTIVADLFFFIFTSIKNSVRKEKLQEFIKHYHKYFTGHLKQLDCNVEDFSFEKFEKEIAEQAPRVLTKIIFMLKVILAEKTAAKELSEFDGSVYSTQDTVGSTYRNKLRGVVLDYIENGWL